MTAARRDLTCPMCGYELSLEALFSDDETRQAVAGLLAAGTPVGTRVLLYLSLFHPPKNRLTVARKIKLVMELLPDLQRGFITRQGAEWQAPAASWAAAIDQMLQLRDEGKLQLPLTGHGYLYAILQSHADRTARLAEQSREDQRRHRTPDAPAAPPAGVGQVVAAPAAPRTAPPPYTPGTSPLVRQMREQLAANKARQESDPPEPQ